MAASGLRGSGAGSDIESYLLGGTGEDGAEIRRVLFFRYRRSAVDLIPPTFHTRVTSGSGSLARYSSHPPIVNVDSFSCSFKFDAAIGESPGGGAAQYS